MLERHGAVSAAKRIVHDCSPLTLSPPRRAMSVHKYWKRRKRLKFVRRKIESLREKRRGKKKLPQ